MGPGPKALRVRAPDPDRASSYSARKHVGYWLPAARPASSGAHQRRHHMPVAARNGGDARGPVRRLGHVRPPLGVVPSAVWTPRRLTPARRAAARACGAGLRAIIGREAQRCEAGPFAARAGAHRQAARAAPVRPQRLSRSGSIRGELIVAVGVALEVVLAWAGVGVGVRRRTGRQARRRRCGVVWVRRAALARSRSWRARRCWPTSARMSRCR
jgi:hypothetical protein